MHSGRNVPAVRLWKSVTRRIKTYKDIEKRAIVFALFVNHLVHCNGRYCTILIGDQQGRTSRNICRVDDGTILRDIDTGRKDNRCGRSVNCDIDRIAGNTCYRCGLCRIGIWIGTGSECLTDFIGYIRSILVAIIAAWLMIVRIFIKRTSTDFLFYYACGKTAGCGIISALLGEKKNELT